MKCAMRTKLLLAMREQYGATVPPVRTSEDKRRRYEAAWLECRKTRPELTFSAWCREAFDRKADADLREAS